MHLLILPPGKCLWKRRAHRNWYRGGSYTPCNSKLRNTPGSVRPSSAHGAANQTMQTPGACLSNLYFWEYVHCLNLLERVMERALEAAWRAVTIDPACQLGWQQLAEAHFFAKDYTAFGDAAERAITQSPQQPHSSVFGFADRFLR